jgi:hypothetical protein
MAESAFIAYLIEIGLRKYENAILPLELGKDLSSSREPDKSPLTLPPKKGLRKKPPE